MSFFDDFETGDKSLWTASNSYAAIVTGAGMGGTYALYINHYTGYTSLDVDSYGEAYITFDYKSVDPDIYGDVIQLRGASGRIAALYAGGWDADNYYMEILKGAYGTVGSSTGLGDPSEVVIPFGNVVSIRFSFKPDPSAGFAKLWVNDVLVIDFSGNTGDSAAITKVTIGDGSPALEDESARGYYDNVGIAETVVYEVTGWSGILTGCSLFPVFDISTGTPDVIPGTSSAYLNIVNNVVSGEEAANDIPGSLGLVVGLSGALASGRPVTSVIPGISGLKAGSGGNLQTVITAEVTGETDIPGWSGLRLGFPAYAGLKSIFSEEEVTATVVIPGTNGLAAGVRGYLSAAPPVGVSTVDIPGTLGLVVGCSLWAPRLPVPAATDIPGVNSLWVGSLAGLVSNLISAVLIPGESGLLVGVLLVEAGEDYEAWVLTGNGFNPSAYTGWQFNSFAKYQGRYFAAGPDGLYLLEGPSQDGEEIISGVRLYTDFGTQRKKWIRAMRLGWAGDEVQVRIASEDKEGYFEVEGDRVVGSYVIRGHNLVIDIQHFEELSHVEITPLVLVAK